MKNPLTIHQECNSHMMIRHLATKPTPVMGRRELLFLPAAIMTDYRGGRSPTTTVPANVLHLNESGYCLPLKIPACRPPFADRGGRGGGERRYPDVGVARRAVLAPTNRHGVWEFGCLPLDHRFAVVFLFIFRFYFGGVVGRFRICGKPDLEIT